MARLSIRFWSSSQWHALWFLAVSAANAQAGTGIYGYLDEANVLRITNIPDQPSYRLIYSEPELAASGKADRKRIRWGPDFTTHLPYASEVTSAANSTGLDPQLLHAVIAVESGYDHRALSRKGAMGLMQLMPNTSNRYGIRNPWLPAENIRGGALYLSELLRTFGDVSLALAAYNAGEGAVIRNGRKIPPFPETRTYVSRVLTRYKKDSLKSNLGPDQVPHAYRSSSQALP